MRVNYNSYNKKDDDDYGYEAPNMGAPIANNMKYPNETFEPNVDYQQRYDDALAQGDFIGAGKAERQRYNKIAGGYGGIYQPTYNLNYNSKYGDKIATLRDNLENYRAFKYDPTKDDAYNSLTRVYSQNAEKAASNALAKAAAANGGRLSSNAIIATDLAYQDKMGQLEAEIPQLRQAAYNMYLNEKSDVRNLMNDHINAENENYSRWNDNYNRLYQNARDLVGDKQWQAQLDYNKERAAASDSQWQTELDYRKETDLRDYVTDERRWQAEMDYNRERDAVSDSQWRDSFEAQYDGRKPSGGSSSGGGSNGSTNPSISQNSVNVQAAYDRAIKGATPAERQQIALNMLTNGEINVNEYQQILSKIAG